MSKFKAFIKRNFTSFAFYYSYLKNKIFLAFFLSLTVSVLDGLGLTMFFPLLQVVSQDGIVNGEDMGQMKHLIDAFEYLGISLTLGSILLLMLAFFSLKAIATYLTRIYLILLQQSFIRKMRLSLLNSLNRMSFKKFILSDVGRIQNTMSGEVDRVARSFNHYFAAFQQGIMVAVYMIFAFFVNPQFAVLVTIGGALTNFIYRIIYKYTKGASKKLTTYNSVFQGQIIQHVGNFKYLKATGKVDDYGEQLKETIYKIEDSRRKIGFLGSVASSFREPILVLIIAIVIYVQITFFEGAIGAIIISLLFFYRALAALVALQNSWNSFMSVSGSLENMQEFKQGLQESKEKPGKVKVASFTDKITFENVDFSYDETKILTNINLSIHKNESIAFVGESGSGKTTMVNLVAGLLPESDGEIKVDGSSLQELNKKSYQSRIGYVSQDAVIFNDTIFNNVTFWAEKTPENITRFEQAIAQASLDEFLSELPEKEETELGNNGINLSGGQKQRVSIARELFKDIDILILDEATSALDSETEKAIQESIDSLHGKYTILIVAHRLSTIRNTDRIVFMDKGEIIDIDSFDRLIEKQERFKKMVELQEL